MPTSWTSGYTGDGDNSSEGPDDFAARPAWGLLHVGVVGSCGNKQGDPHRGGMHSFLWQRGMLLGAGGCGFGDDDADVVSATALAAAHLNLLQPDALKLVKLNVNHGGATGVCFDTTSRTVCNCLKDGPAEGAQQDGPLAKVIQIIKELQACWAAEGITTTVNFQPECNLGNTVAKRGIAGALLLASTADRQCGTYAVVSDDWTVLTVQCDMEGATSYRLGDGAPCQPPKQAITVLQRLLQVEEPDEEDGSGSGGDSSSGSNEEEGECPDDRPVKRARISPDGGASCGL